MEIIVAKLKNDFNNIITIRTTVKNIFDILQIRIDKLKQLYTEFIHSNKNEIFIFGLDSFYFQTKLLDIEYYDMKRLFLAINNRMYCEYFKLHKIIVEYIQKNVDDNKNNNIIKINKYPIYKDLEPFKEYEFEAILDIHENIMNLVSVSISILNNKENELFIYKTKQNIGLNIDNFISTFAFNNIVMREKIQMFTRYIEFFHKMHTKYLKRFSNKIHLMYTNINNDIKFDDSIEISKNKKKELIDEFTVGHIDDDLLKDLKTSIGSETNSENESVQPSETTPPTTSHTTTSHTTDHSPIKPPNTYKEPNTYKDLFKRNVKKASTIFKLFKPKEDPKRIEDTLSNTELDTLFLTINQSCATIINDEETMCGFDIDSSENTIFTGSETSVNPTLDTPVIPTLDTPVIPTLDTPINPTLDTPVIPTLDTPINPTLDTPINPTLDTPINPTLDTSTQDPESLASDMIHMVLEEKEENPNPKQKQKRKYHKKKLL